jgi:hypothetical protein
MAVTKFTLALAALMVTATAAKANVITVSPSDIGTSYAVNYDGFADGQVINGLTGTTSFTLTGVGENSYTFSYSVTSSSPIDASRISGFGFNTNPDITSATSTGLFDRAGSGNVPTGFGRVDVCFKGAGGTANCAGGGGVGVNIGDTGTGSLTLNFAELPQQLTLSDFFVRYQSIDGAGAPDSAIGRGTPGSTSTGGSTGSTGGTPVPAPGGLLLFAAGLAGLGIRFGRKGTRA